MEHLVVEKRLLEAASKVYGQGNTISLAKLNEIADTYGPWKGNWAYYIRAGSGPEMNR